MKKNSISTDEGPSPLKRAITRVLIFYAVKMVAIVVQTVVVNIYAFFMDMIEEHAGIVVLLLTEYAIRKLPFGFISFLSPVISFIYLKPLRDAVVQIKALCTSCKNPPANNGTVSDAHA